MKIAGKGLVRNRLQFKEAAEAPSDGGESGLARSLIRPCHSERSEEPSLESCHSERNFVIPSAARNLRLLALSQISLAQRKRRMFTVMLSGPPRSRAN